MKSSVMLTK